MPNKDEINVESLISTLIRLVVEFCILFFVYFWLLGVNTNVQHSWLFFSVLFILFITTIPIQVQYELIGKYGSSWRHCVNSKRREGLVTECDDALIKQIRQRPDMSKEYANVWRICLPYTLSAGLLGAIGVGAYHTFFGHVIWLEVVFMTVAAIAILMPLVLVVNYKCVFPICYHISCDKKLAPENRLSQDDYSFYNHMLPWFPITLITSLLVTYKMTEELIFSSASLDLLQIAMFTGTSSYFTLLWMYFESKHQTKVDRQIGKYNESGKDSISSEDFKYLLFGVPLGFVILGYSVGYVFLDSQISQFTAIFYISVCAALSGAFGNILGVISCSEKSPVDHEEIDPTDLI